MMFARSERSFSTVSEEAEASSFGKVILTLRPDPS